MTYRVGYAKARITPTLERPVYLAGFAQNRGAVDVHDDLFVRALGVSLEADPGATVPLVILEADPGATVPLVILVALDLIGLARAHALEIERWVREKIPNAQVLVACTHTHHGPDTIGLWGPDMSTTGVDPAYLAWLKDQVVDTCLRAASQVNSADLRAASVRVPGVAKNARDPDIVDDELTCLQFVPSSDESAESTLTLVIFPCHPEVLWEGNQRISSDYPGYLREAIEMATGGECLFFAGALGGMMTPDVKDHSFEEAAHMGEVLARNALQALSGAQTGEELVSFRRAEFPIPMTNPLFRMAIEAGLLPDFLQPDGSLLTEASLVKIGPAWLVGVPGELLPRLGLAVKEMLAQAGAKIPGVVGLANDELGYILHPQDFIYPENPFEPGDHYEETMSVSPEAGPRLMAAIRGMQ